MSDEEGSLDSFVASDGSESDFRSGSDAEEKPKKVPINTL